jgi:hypothetical protein
MKFYLVSFAYHAHPGADGLRIEDLVLPLSGPLDADGIGIFRETIRRRVGNPVSIIAITKLDP